MLCDYTAEPTKVQGGSGAGEGLWALWIKSVNVYCLVGPI